MDAESLKRKLSEAGASETTIQLLIDEEILNCQCLRLSTNELLRTIGLKCGQILAIRRAFPISTLESAAPTPMVEHHTTSNADIPAEISESAHNKEHKVSSAFVETPESKNKNMFDIELPEEASLSPRVLEGLKKGNLIDKARNEYIRDVCNVIRMVTLYPSQSQREHVAHMIVTRYPFLKDSIGSGLGSWEKAIHFRLKNVRKNTKDVKAVKRLHVIPEQEKETKAIKPKEKKQKSLHQAGSVPSLPEGETLDTCADHVKKMVKEMEKGRNRNLTLVKQLMELTFPLRRKEVLEGTKTVEGIVLQYPALALPVELKREFGRIVGKPTLARECATEFQDWVPRIVSFSRTSPSTKNIILEMTAAMAEDNKKEIENAAAIILLTMLLKEKRGKLDSFIKIVTDDDDEGIDHFIETSSAPRIVGAGNMFQPDPLYICIEGKAVVGPLTGVNASLVETAILLLACYYTFNLEYPDPKNMFLFLEALMLKTHDALKGRVSILKLLNSLKH